MPLHFLGDTLTPSIPRRWQILVTDASRFVEVDSGIEYRNGKVGSLASTSAEAGIRCGTLPRFPTSAPDAISRLPTQGYYTTELDDDVPLFIISDTNDSLLLSLKQPIEDDLLLINNVTGTESYKSKADDITLQVLCDDEAELIKFREKNYTKKQNYEPILRSVMIAVQKIDEDCMTHASTVGAQYSQFIGDMNNMLVRVSKLDSSRQVVMPKFLRPRML